VGNGGGPALVLLAERADEPLSEAEPQRAVARGLLHLILLVHRTFVAGSDRGQLFVEVVDDELHGSELLAGVSQLLG